MDSTGSIAGSRGAREVATPTDADLKRARVVVSAHLRPTPLVTLDLPGERGSALAKVESLHPTGSFKVRGGIAALSAYAGKGERVVTASAGNHGLGVAYAAARLGARATVVVSKTASPAKVSALRRLGVELIEHGASYDDAERRAIELAEGGAVFVSAYNDPHVIAGQATCAAEILQEISGEVTLIVPVGGGGLLAGTALWARSRADVHIVGVEAEASRGMSAAVAAGRIVEVPVAPTLADGLAGNLEPGTITPALTAGRMRAFVAVTEAEIEEAIRFLALRCGLVVEGSGAVGVAALLAGKAPVAGRAVVMLTGRNIAPEPLARILGAAAP